MSGCLQPGRFYLIRHGETDANSRAAYLGWDDPPLSERGQRQAGWLAAKLTGTCLTAIYSSDLRRAADTATIIAACHGITVVHRPALRELDFGEWSGLTYDAIAARDPVRLRDWINDPAGHSPPGGETLKELTARVRAGTPLCPNIAIVTHGGPIRALLASWTGRSMWDFAVPPGCLVTVERDGERLLPTAFEAPPVD